MPGFEYAPTFQHVGDDRTDYELIDEEGIRVIEAHGEEVLTVDPKLLRRLSARAFREISFFLRRRHLDQVAAILDDPEASGNDRFVAATLLRNAIEAARGILPSCQDTGTATIVAHKGEKVWTGIDDAEALAHGVYDTWQHENLRYSQMAPLDMFAERNTGTNLPAQIDIYHRPGMEYHLLFVAKGGGSANKMFLHQKTRSLLDEASLDAFLREQLFGLGTAACPPYHIVVAIGGTSAEATLKTVKLASTGALDDLPTTGDESGRAFRDREWEARVLRMARESKIGAQFGGKYLAHDVRVIRLPRHGASCPVGIGVSCSADRQVKAKITRAGTFLERLEKDPASRYGGRVAIELAEPVEIDLDAGIDAVRAELAKHPVGTRCELAGTLIVARDIAHAKVRERLAAGEPMPDYFRNHPIYYAGPAKTPTGMASGSFGPTTAGRMDDYVGEFQREGGSLVMLAKGNRSPAVTAACAAHGGFYLGSIGGPAAILAKESITASEVVDFPELGMEAVRRIRVEKFPAFIVVDDKGNDLFARRE